LLSFLLPGRRAKLTFDDKTTEELIKLAKAGLGFTLNTSKFDHDDLLEIKNAAAEGGAQIKLIDDEGE
jgi:hypothetical protein